MSVSIHMNGGKRSDMKKGIHVHQVRVSEKEGKQVAKHSDSEIDPRLSSMNINYFDDPDRFSQMRKKIDKISDERVKAGGKKLYRSANVFMVGTIQISDDSLERLGWRSDERGQKLPADKQSKEALANVKAAYADLVNSVKKQPEVYGDVFSATLHFDETTPHVDLLSDPLDEAKPDQTARTFLNGPKGTKKGVAMRKMQDNLTKYSRFDDKVKEKFGLVRGDTTAKKKDKLKQLRNYEKDLVARESQYQRDVMKNAEMAKAISEYGKDLNKQSVKLQLEKDEQRKKHRELDRKEEALNERSEAFERYIRQEREKIVKEAQKRSQELSERSRAIQSREAELEQREAKFEHHEAKLEQREKDVQQRESKVAELFRLLEEKQKAFERLVLNTKKWVNSGLVKAKHVVNVVGKGLTRVDESKNDQKQVDTVNLLNGLTDLSLETPEPDVKQQAKKTAEQLDLDFTGLDTRNLER